MKIGEGLSSLIGAASEAHRLDQRREATLDSKEADEFVESATPHFSLAC